MINILQILQHWASEFFAPLAVIAQVRENDQVHVYVVNDRLAAAGHLLVRLEIFRWSSLEPSFSNTTEVSMVRDPYFP